MGYYAVVSRVHQQGQDKRGKTIFLPCGTRWPFAPTPNCLSTALLSTRGIYKYDICSKIQTPSLPSLLVRSIVIELSFRCYILNQFS